MADAPRSTAELDFAIGSVTPSPADWRDCFMYFLLVDRFDDGGDHPAYQPGVAPKGRDAATAYSYQGGTLRGVIRRLDYIRDLGCTALWISPIMKTRAERVDYHGYAIQDFLQVEPRFGTLDDLQELVREAHARGIYVVLDIVLNHTGDNWSYPNDARMFWKDEAGPYPFGAWRKVDPGPDFGPNDAVWPVQLRNPNVYKRRGRITNYDDPAQAMNGDFINLKELETRDQKVLDALIAVYKHWIAVTDCDGFRIDTVKNVESSATALFCNAIREYALSIGKKNFLLFGEVAGDDETLQRYLGRNARIDGTTERFPSLDACLDFPLYFLLEEVVKSFRSPADLKRLYEDRRLSYADFGAAASHFVTFLDNHDQIGRPYRRFLHGNPVQAQAAVAVAYLLCSMGTPCLYYGTEQGFDGGGDRDVYVREAMFGGRWGAFDTTGAHFFDPQHPLYRSIRDVAAVRAKLPPLRYGRQYFRESAAPDTGFHLAPGLIAFSRILDRDEVLVALNLQDRPRTDSITVDGELSPPGSVLQDRLSNRTFTVENRDGRACVRLDLAPCQIAILAPLP